MTKFFRNIRQRLLRENRASKYLLYAIGEIILVVIGILIALQVSNSNEQRKKDEEARKLLVQIQDDLLHSIKYLNIQRRVYKIKDSLCNMVLTDTLTISSYKNPNGSQLKNLTYTIAPIRIQKEGFKSFIPKIEQFSTKFTDLEPIIKSHYLKFDFSYEEGQNSLKNLQERQTHYAMDQPWYNLLLTPQPSSDDMADYFLNNQRYKNEVLAYKRELNMVVSVGLAIEKSAVDLYNKIYEVTDYPEELPSEVANYYAPNAKNIAEKLVGDYAYDKNSSHPASTLTYEDGQLKGNNTLAYILSNNRILFLVTEQGGVTYKYDIENEWMIPSSFINDTLKKMND